MDILKIFVNINLSFSIIFTLQGFAILKYEPVLQYLLYMIMSLFQISLVKIQKIKTEKRRSLHMATTAANHTGLMFQRLREFGQT